MVSSFVPKDHIVGTRMNYDAQKAEYLWCNKALHLLYGGDRENSAKEASPLEGDKLN